MPRRSTGAARRRPQVRRLDAAEDLLDLRAMKRAPSVLLLASVVAVGASAGVAPRAARAEGPAAAPSAPAPPAPTTPKERLTGVFLHAGGDREIAARDEAIDKATESMFFAIKGMARSKLRERLPVPKSIRIAFVDGKITVAAEGEVVTTSPESGATVPHTSTSGQPSKLTQQLTADGKLVQKTEGEGGSRTSVYAASADGKAITVQHTVESPKLPKPVRYTLTYRRR